MTDQEKLDVLTKHLVRVANSKVYGDIYPAERARAIAMEILHSDLPDAKAIFVDYDGRTFVRDTFIDNAMFALAASSEPQHKHLFAQTPEPVEKTEQQKQDEFFKSPEFLTLDPVKRAQLYDSMTAEARAAEKEAESKAVAEAVRLAASRIPEFQSWEPSRKSAFADRITAIEREKARKGETA